MELTEEMIESLVSALRVEEKLQQRKAEHQKRIGEILVFINEQCPEVSDSITEIVTLLNKIEVIDEADIDVDEVD